MRKFLRLLKMYYLCFRYRFSISSNAERSKMESDDEPKQQNRCKILTLLIIIYKSQH